MDNRRICFITGTRAEYGLLYWLITGVKNDADLDLQLVVTGTHLEEAFGETARDIEADGFKIDAKIPLAIQEDSGEQTAAAMARALAGTAKALTRLKPDLLVILGDRYEILAAAEAAMLVGVPIAHIHGGELTEGAMDDAMRHAITKISHLHFTAAEPYRQRVIQMGENPQRVFNVGAVGLDNIARLNFPARAQLAEALDFKLDKPFFLVTYHPETLGAKRPGEMVDELLAALDDFPGHRVIITGVNADPGHSQISSRISAYARNAPDRVLLFRSLGQKNYLGAMKHCAAVVGNSSSGIIEAPAFPVPTVNIGDRQKGRIRAACVVDCGPMRRDIAEALKIVLDDTFKERMENTVSPLGHGGVAEKILGVIKSVELSALQTKPFFNIPAQEAI